MAVQKSANQLPMTLEVQEYPTLKVGSAGQGHSAWRRSPASGTRDTGRGGAAWELERGLGVRTGLGVRPALPLVLLGTSAAPARPRHPAPGLWSPLGAHSGTPRTTLSDVCQLPEQQPGGGRSRQPHRCPLPLPWTLPAWCLGRAPKLRVSLQPAHGLQSAPAQFAKL